MDIRKIIREEVGKVFSENYPWGAEYDPNAPWNQVDNVRPGERAKKTTFNIYWTDDSEFAFFSGPDGNKYVMYLEAIDKDELEPYADREEKYMGRDEDGMPDIEYGDWEITSDVIENYVNDNNMRIGKGLNDWENGEHDLVMLDDELRQDLLGTAKYFKDEKKRQQFINAIMAK
jgi:hypothetical protein